MAITRRWRALAAVAVAASLGGCASMQESDVRDVATAFADPAGDPGARCDLLTPATRETLESDGSGSCADVVGRLPLTGGAVEAVEVWGDQAQVRLVDDTLFLTRTRVGWRVSAAACEPRGEAPYDCEVEAP